MTSIFETLVQAAHRAGELTRSGAKAARSAWETVEPGVTTALTTARSLADPKAREEAYKHFDAILERAKGKGNSALSDLQATVNSLREAASGVPPQVAIKLATFASVEEVAAAKGASDLAEMRKCHEAVEAIRAAVKANAAADVTTASEALDPLIIAAGSAVDKFSSDEQVVLGLLSDGSTLLSDIKKLNLKTVAAEAERVAIIVGATLGDVDLGATLVALTDELAAAQAAYDGGDFAGAAVYVHNWTATAQAALLERRATWRRVRQEADKPESLEGLFSAFYARAEELNFVGDADLADKKLMELAGQTLKAVRKRPCDVSEASSLCDLFRDRLNQLEAEQATKQG